MNEYDQYYYFIRRPKNSDNLPSLTPDHNTEDRKFRFEKQPLGSPPLVFYNGAREYNLKRRIKSVAIPPDILFEGPNFVVHSRIREALLNFDIPHLHMHPAIYIHDNEKWYEDYWYLTFTERFGCWGRNNSDYDQDDPPVRLGDYELEQVYTYSLNKDLLDKTPQEQRLLFQMGGVLDASIVCHQKLSTLFAGRDSGAQLTKISDY